MSTRDSINLFNSKINCTYWTRQNISPTGRILSVVPNPTLLNTENYYKILQKKYVKIGDNSGFAPALSTSNFAEYFANDNTNEAIAVVNSVKTINSTPTKIAIATYYDKSGEIVILNRFDQTGRPHDNYFNVYGTLSTDKLDFYKKYLSDREFTDDQGTLHNQVYVPHIHFNTRSQALVFGHHDKANAISIFGLIRYLTDLKNDLNPNSLLNTVDMGMPFLDFKKARIDYTSTMMSSVGNIVGYLDMQSRVDPSKFNDFERETLELMKSLINIDPGDSGTSSTPNDSSDGDNSSSGSNHNPTATSNSTSGSNSGSNSGSSSGSSSGSTSISSSSSGSTTSTGSGSLNNNYIGYISGLSEGDLSYIETHFPSLETLNIRQLLSVKKHFSKLLRQLETEKKEYQNNNKDYQRNRDYEKIEMISVYRDYLKYVKGLINLESILVDLKKYLELYSVLNERNPLLLSEISKELLKGLTINVSEQSEFNKGGQTYDDNLTQSQPE